MYRGISVVKLAGPVIGGVGYETGSTGYAIDRNPENGCEIQNAADGVSGIIMRLKLCQDFL